jgi:hypothetical protein
MIMKGTEDFILVHFSETFHKPYSNWQEEDDECTHSKTGQ